MAAPFRQIVVATDFSAGAEHAVRVACELSRVYSAPLTLIHVCDPTSPPLPEGWTLYMPAQMSRLWEDLERHLAAAAREARAAGATCVTTQLLEGLPAAEIVRCAKDGGHDLIVIGSHGRKGVARVLLGSVAARVVQTAECPVLTVKRAAEHAPVTTTVESASAATATP